MKLKFATLTTLACILLVLSGCNKPKTRLIKDSDTPLPDEKIGLDGEYDPSALAKRVVEALEKDTMLGDKSTVYVAQKGNIIVLKGRVDDRYTLDKIVNVVRNVKGVFEVDTSQIQTR